MHNVYLTGMPGSGKTTLGVMLSERLGLEFIDTDHYITEKQRRTVPDIFKTRGEAYFRDLETQALIDLSHKDRLLVSTGGGIILRPKNVELMKKSGTVVFIDTPPAQILKNSELKNRPLLKGGDERVFALYEERIARYRESADHILVNTGAKDDAANALYHLLSSILSGKPGWPLKP